MWLCTVMGLSNETQNFHMNGVSSGPIAVNFSVPQGPVLGPTKFGSYMEDISIVFYRHQVRYHLYVDDKEAFIDVPVENVGLARRVLENYISDVANWCSSRRLHLNVKTEPKKTNRERLITATPLRFCLNSSCRCCTDPGAML